MKKCCIILVALTFFISAKAQLLKSGPWAGNVELRNAAIWLEVDPSVKFVTVHYSPTNKKESGKSIRAKVNGNIVKISLPDLEMNTRYTYSVLLDEKPVKKDYPLRFTTKELWQHRKPAPDFNFLAGSCSYFNEPVFDRPGKPYGMDSSIFITMGNTPAAFNLWLGDSWYTRESDFYTVEGLRYRASRDRGMQVVQKLFASMPQYYIWDDHDFGPNNAGKSYILKEESRQVFKDYTLNPSYGEDGKGIYTMFSFGDVDIFMTDDRYFRSETNYPDSMNGKPDPSKTYFGTAQMNWLKNALLYSKAAFKIIASGSQILNPVSNGDCMRKYSYEFTELTGFLSKTKIPGVIFLTGDRHHSEVIKLDRENVYPLYDITVSPLTASVGKVRTKEINNDARVAGTLVEAQNFGNISVTGKKDERILKVIFTGITGEKLAEWSIRESELR